MAAANGEIDDLNAIFSWTTKQQMTRHITSENRKKLAGGALHKL